MPTILKVEKIAEGVVLNDSQTSYNCRPVNLSGIAVGNSPMYYAIGSNPVSSGTFSGTLNGALSEADLAISAKRIVVDSTLFSATGAAAIARQLKSFFTTSSSPTITPWQQAVLSRASGASTEITVDVWAVWMEQV